MIDQSADESKRFEVVAMMGRKGARLEDLRFDLPTFGSVQGRVVSRERQSLGQASTKVLNAPPKTHDPTTHDSICDSQQQATL